MDSHKGKWYVVWVGTEPGICETWEDCKARVENYPGARYKAFKYQEDAIRAFRGTPEESMDILRAIAKAPNKHVNYDAIPDIIPGSIAVDAACSGNPGVMEYRGVDISTGAELFRVGPFSEGTNNIGEFLAIVHGLALLQKMGQHHMAIYSDSVTGMAWVRDRHCKTKITRNSKNAKLFELVRRAETWLATHSYYNRIIKWNTNEWGEIPADFGRK